MKTKIDAALIRRLKKEQVLELARRSLTSVIAHIILFGFVAWVTPLRADHGNVFWIFGILICSVSVIRIILGKRVSEKYDKAPVFWNISLAGLNSFAGSCWGALGIAMGMFYSLEWPFLFLMVINSGLAAGATSSLGPDFKVSTVFTCLMLIPLSVIGFVQNTSLGVGVGILSLFSTFMFIRMAKDNYQWYWENIENMEQITNQSKVMAGVFKEVRQDADSLNAAALGLTEFSNKMNKNAEDMRGKLTGVVGLTADVNKNSETIVALIQQATEHFSNIASAAEEMTTTIADIADSTRETRRISEQAVVQTEHAVQKMKVLDDAAAAINKITETIGEISEQINLLALNATIEAARAGDAGKGFSVVAAEIKELAVQTSASAGKISTQVKGIQDSTKDTSLSMAGIKEIVLKADKHVETITRVVDEQSGATREVAENINEMSSGFVEVGRIINENDGNLKNVSAHIAELEISAGNVNKGAKIVDKNAARLKDLAFKMSASVDQQAS